MATDRRRRIVAMLHKSVSPITGSELAALAHVSRQVIVQDIAVLRAQGEEIVATPQGYVLSVRLAPVASRAIFACRHKPEDTEDELTTMVDLGLRVIDVIVEHPIYGELRGLLTIESRNDVAVFVRRVRESGAALLSALTNGVHLHTVEASRPEILARARKALASKGYILGPSNSLEQAVLSLDKTPLS